MDGLHLGLLVLLVVPFFFDQETQFWFPEMAGLDSGTEGTVAIAGIDWFAGPSGPDNQAGISTV